VDVEEEANVEDEKDVKEGYIKEETGDVVYEGDVEDEEDVEKEGETIRMFKMMLLEEEETVDVQRNGNVEEKQVEVERDVTDKDEFKEEEEEM
jgi:hypothetical protein